MDNEIQQARKAHRLRLYPDSMLRGMAHRIDNMDGDVHWLLDSMVEIMYTHGGGLAAPQVGVMQRMIIADIGEGLLALANPAIVEKEGDDHLVEGCLSLPDIQVDIARSQSVLVQGINPKGQEVRQEFEGLMARIIQHEIDHLDGVLIIDYASPVEKIALRKKLKALRERYG